MQIGGHCFTSNPLSCSFIVKQLLVLLIDYDTLIQSMRVNDSSKRV